MGDCSPTAETPRRPEGPSLGWSQVRQELVLSWPMQPNFLGKIWDVAGLRRAGKNGERLAFLLDKCFCEGVEEREAKRPT